MQPFEFHRRTARRAELVEPLLVGVLHGHSEKKHLFVCLRGVDPLDGFGPAGGVPVACLTVGDETNPGPVVRDARVVIVFFAGLERLAGEEDRLRHGGRALGGKPGGSEGGGRNEAGQQSDLGAEGEHGDFHALAGETVAAELLGEKLDAPLELLYRFARHGTRGVEHQHARTAWFGIAGKREGSGEGGLSGHGRGGLMDGCGGAKKTKTPGRLSALISLRLRAAGKSACVLWGALWR